MQLEVVVTDATEAAIAERAGASRLELVDDLERGGVTPKTETIEAVCRAVSIPVHVMVRPHDNGFVYNAAERQVILETARSMRDLGASAIVFGALDERGQVAVQLVREVVATSRLPMTFHRAFDETPVLSATYATLCGIRGVERVLTTGGAASAWEGRACLRELCYGNTAPIVLAAGAIDETNLPDLLRYTRVQEIHVASGVRTDGRVDGRKIERLAQLLENR